MNQALAFRRVLSGGAAAALVVLAPGLPAYQAAAQVIRVEAPSASASRAVVAATGASASAVPALAPSAGLLAPSALSVAPAPLAAPLAAALPSAALAAAARPAASVSSPDDSVAVRALAPVTREVASALRAAGDLGSAPAASLRGLGERLEAALTGAPALPGAADLAAPADGPLGELSERGGHLARPAGDLIRQAAQAHDGPTAAEPPLAAPPAPRGPKAPFFPKLIAAGLAVAPVWWLGLPLLAAGSTLLGALTIAGAASLAVMPFLGENAPRPLRAAPGAALAGLGAAALAAGLLWPGAFALVGGWGLVRYGLGRSPHPSDESVESLSAYFGGVAALTTAALAALGPAGWLAAALPWATYPASVLLWLHLPSWVGEGVGSAFEGVWLGAKGSARVMGAVARDTVLLDRLEKFSSRYWDQSKWNGVWLAVMWTPIMLWEAAKFALGAAAGVYAGLVTAPVMFLWGASYKLFGAGEAAVYFGEAARFVFDRVQNGKAALFNRVEAKVLPLANSNGLAQRALGSLAINALQLGWILYTAVATPLLTLAGLLTAFGKTGKPFDAARHSPSSLRVSTSDNPGTKPADPTTPDDPAPAKAPLAPKLIAAALALVPAVYFGWPLLAGSLIQGGLYALLVLPLAAMPFMGPRTPAFFKSLAGRALLWNGLALLLFGQGLLVGALAALGGWGFRRYVASTLDGKDRRFDDSAELGAFFGALGAAAGVGAAWLGLTGPLGWGALALAAVTSPFLLIHLPSWVWYGLRGSLRGIPQSMSDYARVLGFWQRDSEFLPHLGEHARYWLRRTYWNGVWLSVIWVPTGLVVAAEYVLSLALGLATGLLRAPLGFLAGAAAKSEPYGKASLFFGAALEAWSKAAEGSKVFFDKMIAPLKPTLNDKTSVSGRPTVWAALALLAARAVQLGWLIGVLAVNLTGASLVWGLLQGARAAFAAPAPRRLYTPAFEIDGPLNGATAEEILKGRGRDALASFLKTLTQGFDAEKIPYDPARFVPEAVEGAGVELAYGPNQPMYATVFAVLTLTPAQAALARRYALRMADAPPAKM